MATTEPSNETSSRPPSVSAAARRAAATARPCPAFSKPAARARAAAPLRDRLRRRPLRPAAAARAPRRGTAAASQPEGTAGVTSSSDSCWCATSSPPSTTTAVRTRRPPPTEPSGPGGPGLRRRQRKDSGSATTKAVMRSAPPGPRRPRRVPRGGTRSPAKVVGAARRLLQGFERPRRRTCPAPLAPPALERAPRAAAPPRPPPPGRRSRAASLHRWMQSASFESGAWANVGRARSAPGSEGPAPQQAAPPPNVPMAAASAVAHEHVLELLGGDARVRVYESFPAPRGAARRAPRRRRPVAFDRRRRRRGRRRARARGRRRVLVRFLRREELVGGLDLCVVICLASFAIDAHRSAAPLVTPSTRRHLFQRRRIVRVPPARLGLDLRDGALRSVPPPAPRAPRCPGAASPPRAQDARRAAQEQDALREVARRADRGTAFASSSKRPSDGCAPGPARAPAQRRPGLGHGPPRRAHDEVAAEVAADAPRAAGS